MNLSRTICISILVLAICLVLPACRKGNQNNNLCIQKGFFQATLTESGELLALNARSVLMPYVGWQYGGRFKLTGLVEHGTQVHEGDSVAQVDPANVYKFLMEQENLLEVEKANLAKLLVEQSIRFRELDANLKEIQADYDLKKLELERFKFESERKNEIKQLEFSQATVHLERIQRTIELERTISANSLKIQKIKVAQIESNINEARNAVKKLTIKSPIDGMFQISKSRMTNQLYKVGDDTYQGAELALVPDLSLIKVKSTVNEADIGKVKVGQKVIVRLEAFPDKPFHGRITDLGKLSYKKEEESKIKIFDSEIILDESDPVLKPGMTVSCEIVFAELEDVFYVDNKCLKKVNGTFYIRMKGKDGWVDQQVEIGPRNNKNTVIYGDFKQGTALMLPQETTLAYLDKKVTINKAL